MKTEIEKEMQLFENECKVLCYKGDMSRSNLGSFYNNEQTNWMYQMWLSSKNREGYKLVPVETLEESLSWASIAKWDSPSKERDLEFEKHEKIIEAMIGACDDH